MNTLSFSVPPPNSITDYNCRSWTKPVGWTIIQCCWNMCQILCYSEPSLCKVWGKKEKSEVSNNALWGGYGRGEASSILATQIVIPVTSGKWLYGILVMHILTSPQPLVYCVSLPLEMRNFLSTLLQSMYGVLHSDKASE